MRYLVTGVTGQLGHDVVMELYGRGITDILGIGRSPEYSGVCSDYPECGIPYRKADYSDPSEVSALFDSFRPDYVIHCASWTKVDMAEWPENRNDVLRSNVFGTMLLAEMCRRYNACMVYISTDYVFCSDNDQPLSETVPAVSQKVTELVDKLASMYRSDDIATENRYEGNTTQMISEITDSLPSYNLYGRTKLAGELLVRRLLEKHYIIRVSWSFGHNGSNFVKTMLKLGKARQITPLLERSGDSPSPLTVVNDQIGRPTYTADAAHRIIDILEHGLEYGVYHAVNSGAFVSWCDFTRDIFSVAGMRVPVVAVTTKDYELSVRTAEDRPRADRPYNSRIISERAEQQGLSPMPDHHDALIRYLRLYLSHSE